LKDGAGEGLLEGRQKRVDVGLRHPGSVRVLQRVGRHDADNVVREQARGLQHDGPAHRMADENDASQLQGLDDGRDIFAESSISPVGAVDAGVAVPGKVERRHPMRAGELVELTPPVGAVSEPAVDEHQGDGTGPARLVADGDAVGRERDATRPGRRLRVSALAGGQQDRDEGEDGERCGAPGRQPHPAGMMMAARRCAQSPCHNLPFPETRNR
jgi:hypothetical protein